MNKYIIKNCPAYCYLGKECHNEEDRYGSSCCEITNCIMKRIVKECTNSLRFSCERILAEKLLGLLDIQEVK